MKVKTVLGAIVVVVLFFFASIFALASTRAYGPTRLIVAGLLLCMGLGVAYYVTRKPKTVIQRVELSGAMATVALKCPNCSASLKAEQIKVVSGVPYVTCPYCGQTSEVTEEPKW